MKPCVVAGALLLLCSNLRGETAPAPAADKNLSPDQLNVRGIAAFEKNDLATGRTLFRQVLQMRPDSLIALLNLGSLEYRAGRLVEAASLLTRAARVEPRSVAAWLTLGVVSCEQGKIDAAIAALAQAVLLEPENVKAHSYFGVTLGRKGWLDGAEAELLRAIELDDNYRDAHFNLAVVYLQRTPPSLELARRHYRHALELGASPDSLVEKQLNVSQE